MITLEIFGQSPFEGPGTGSTTDHLIEIVVLLFAAWLLGLWIGRLTKKSKPDTSLVESKQEEINDFGQQLKDKEMYISTLQEKIKLLESRNSQLSLVVNQPNAGSSSSVLEAKIKNQEQLIDNLKQEVRTLNEQKAQFENPPVIAANISDEVEEVKLEEEKVETEVVVSDNSSKDDLKKIEGIGPKIEQLLNADGVYSYDDIIQTGPDKIKEILLKSGPQYKVHDPATWPEQANLAKESKWDELHQMQAALKGGKKV